MTREELINNCRYYKGEEKCPFTGGRHVWWKIERYGVEAKDKVNKGLSKKMLDFILWRIWESDYAVCDFEDRTDMETAIKRANELYELGKWSVGYIADATDTMDNAY